ncbi:substrate-binding domain-containing protein [Raineyella sp. W15-4]|uniref:substrate-binding domain-containing protein n=1 Tax=Raineyella sp. W15-4 TaxID=3081651 RepID=UPI002955B54F|nr:substrate-binding domain-containing protein [Raineyella sp. W15-4]WOQ17461.1 substrate-binding domain-containing protein [Raineyella sp. W15-4]
MQQMAIRIGVIIPFQHAAGMFGAAAEAASEFAAQQINATDGILGREVALEFIDGGADPREVMTAVDRGIRDGRLDAVTGWHDSSLRNRLVPLIAGRVPYVYSAVYEGNETRRGTYCLGETPASQLMPALRRLAASHRARRWLVVGDDYVWPRQTYRTLEALRVGSDIDLLGAVFFGDQTSPALDRQKRLLDILPTVHCDGILLLKLGHNAVEFNRGFAARGLHRTTTRLSPLMEESMLMASGIDGTRNLFSTGGFFRTLHTAGSAGLLSAYSSAEGGVAPPLTAPAESCYDSIWAVKAIAERAGSPRVPDTDRVIDGLHLETPRGLLSFEGNQADQNLHLAEADGYDFEVVATWRGAA